jgi:hypothetical protein
VFITQDFVSVFASAHVYLAVHHDARDRQHQHERLSVSQN